METGQLKGIIEAALLAYGQPLSIDQLREMFDEFERPDATAVRKALLALADDCEGRPMELVEVASGWRLQVRSQFSARLSKLWQERPTRYSRALLETLALIAYRQPITRGEIEDVRGVTVNPNIVRTLTERGWIRVVGHREVPGHPELLGTTREFLDYFGLKSPTSFRRSRRCVTWTTSASSSNSTDPRLCRRRRRTSRPRTTPTRRADAARGRAADHHSCGSASRSCLRRVASVRAARSRHGSRKSG